MMKHFIPELVFVGFFGLIFSDFVSVSLDISIND